MAGVLTLALAYTLKHALKLEIGLPVSCLLVAVWSLQLARRAGGQPQFGVSTQLEYLLKRPMKVLAASGG
jgi:hypothetical protein